jgi:hypothetical protein
MKSINKFEFLSENETWNISDVLRLLCGSLKVSDAYSIILCQSRQPLGKLMETAADNGRFGKVTVYMEPDSEYTPHWDIPFLTEIIGGHFVDENQTEISGDHFANENLELILDLPVHPLRVIEWIDDAFEYDETTHSLKIEAETFTLNPQVFAMLQEWRTRRDQGKIKDSVADVSFEKLVKADLWVRTEIHVALFGETYSERYPSFIYHHYKPKLEEHLSTVDAYIDGALATEKLKKYPHQGAKSLLIENHGFDEYHENKDNYQGIDIYTDNELKGRKEIVPKDALEVLKFKGYPVPDGLIEAINDGKWEKAGKLFKKLREGFLYFVEHGELPSVDIEASRKEKEFFPAPEGTTWGDIRITITEETGIKIIIKTNEQLFYLDKFKKLIPSKTSRALLFSIIQAGGILDRSTLDKKTHEFLKQYLSKLRKDLKELFGVHEDPIEYNGNGEYKINFKISNLLISPKS